MVIMLVYLLVLGLVYGDVGRVAPANLFEVMVRMRFELLVSRAQKIMLHYYRGMPHSK